MLIVIYNAHHRLGVSLIIRKRSLIIGNRSTDSNNGGWMVPSLNYSFIYWMDYAISLGILMSLHPLSCNLFGRLQEFSVETAIATVVDGNDSLKIDTKNLRELSIRVGSMYQFIGELLIQPDNEVSCKYKSTKHMEVTAHESYSNVNSSGVIVIFQAVLQARVGRNVDGIDINLYHQSLQLLRQFQANHLKNPSA